MPRTPPRSMNGRAGAGPAAKGAGPAAKGAGPAAKGAGPAANGPGPAVDGAAALRALSVALIGLAAAAPAALAQSALSLGGIEARVGLVMPERAELGTGVFAEVDLGYFRTPPLRVMAGVSQFAANIDREPGDNEGSYRATGLWFGGRFDLLGARDLAPYVRGALTIQRVSADAFDAEVGALLKGTNLGTAAAIGLRSMLDRQGYLSATAELRRTFINNIGHTALEVGVRWQLRGRRMYVPDPEPLLLAERTPPSPPRDEPVPTPPDLPDDQAERLAEIEEARRRTEAERAAIEAERAALEAARAARGAALAEAELREREELERRRAEAAEAMLRQGIARAAATMRSATDMRETDAGFILTIGGNAFPSGARNLSSAARAEVRVLATVLAGYPGHIIMVEGHTDSAGDPRANQTLSEERAAAVRAALIVEGVDPLWIGSRGFGEQRPIASNATAAGRAANRRVEVHVSRVRCQEPPVPDAGGALVCPR